MVQARACKALYSGSIPLAASSILAGQGHTQSALPAANANIAPAVPSTAMKTRGRACIIGRLVRATPTSAERRGRPRPPLRRQRARPLVTPISTLAEGQRSEGDPQDNPDLH